MKILHTSDLHIGKRLYHIDLLEDQLAYFLWLIDLIREESIDALVISGDIFDVANPSSEARKLYYEVLVGLSALKCKVIITGGNHDSPAVLEAPKEVLKTLDIHVIGAQPESLEEAIIEVPNEDGNPELIIVAVPYLRDRDLRQMTEGEDYDDRVEAIQSGIRKKYLEMAEFCISKYPTIPAIATGHLYVNNAVISDSEREIQIGNLAGIERDTFPEHFRYLALGHLHRPQEVGSDSRIIYSGSPYPLSFSEKDNKNRVMLLTLDNGELSQKSVEVPSNRRLLKYSGSLEKVTDQLNNYQPLDTPFATLIEVEVIEENYDPILISNLELAIDAFKGDNASIIKHRIQFKNKVEGTAKLYSISQHIEDLKPRDVFIKRLESEPLMPKSRTMILEAFEEILEIIQNED
jgi:DNA repair protein SbcD/Mre11